MHRGPLVVGVEDRGYEISVLHTGNGSCGVRASQPTGARKRRYRYDITLHCYFALSAIDVLHMAVEI